MAGGMHAAAQETIGGITKEAKNDDDVVSNSARSSMERGESVEIITLSKELSHNAFLILQERHLKSNPARAATRRVVQCHGDDDFADTEKQTGGGTTPMTTSLPLTKILFNAMPILTWFPRLKLREVYLDIIAGLTVGVMVIPQSMSYANIAGLPYIYGMYSACVPLIVYGLFGQSRQLAVGPVAMVSLLVEAGLRGKLSEQECPEWYAVAEADRKAQYEYPACEQAYVQLAVLTSLVVGGMQLLAAILKLGFLVSFLGHPVTSGFTSGAAIIIALSQIKYIFGFDLPKSHSIIETGMHIAEKLGQTNGMSLVLGLFWLGFLITNKKAAAKYPNLRIMGPLGPLISCAVGTLLIWGVSALREKYKVDFVGEIPEGLMPLSLNWSLADISKVFPTALSSCLIGYMESIAIGKNLAAANGYEIEAGQELLALGLSNIAGACFSCYPVTGSFSRSAVNNSTGAQTQLSGIITAGMMLVTLVFLTPLFHYLPKFALAAIVMNSVIPLVAIQEARKLWRVKKHDFFLWVLAFAGTLALGVLEGIGLAVVFSLSIVIYESVRPQLTVLWRIPGTNFYRNVYHDRGGDKKQESDGVFIPNVFICRIGSSMYFANAAYIKDMLFAYVADMEEVNKIEYIILEMTPVVSIDSTAVHAIHDIVDNFHRRDIYVGFAKVGNRVDKTMRKAQLKEYIGADWFFDTGVHEGVQYCLKHQYTKKQLYKDDALGHHHVTARQVLAANVTVTTGTEMGFNNDMDHECTTVFISLVRDVDWLMSEITSVLKRNAITIVRMQIEPMPESDGGAKHTYWLKCIKTKTKLTDYQIERLREELQGVIDRHKRALMMPTPPCGKEDCSTDGKSNVSKNKGPDIIFGSNGEAKIKALEAALAEAQKENTSIQKELQRQGQQIDIMTSGRVGDEANLCDAPTVSIL